MDFLMIFSDFEAVFAKHSTLRVLKGTKKYGKRAKKPFLGLVLARPKSEVLFNQKIGIFPPIFIRKNSI